MSDTVKQKGTTTVTVMSALPSAHEFNLPDGKILTIKGRPESLFVGENGLPLEGNQYGETTGIKKEDWSYIMKTYGTLPFFKSEVVFAVENQDQKKAKKKDNKKLKTGLEQVDTKKTRTTPKPKDKA